MSGDKHLAYFRARLMEEEAVGHVTSVLWPSGGLPRMTTEEVIDQERRFLAVTWVIVNLGEFHKVGLARNGQLAFSHHTMKELRRMEAFAELGGTPCPCVNYLRLFDFDGGEFVPLPPHFRTEVNRARSRAAYRLVGHLEARGYERRATVKEDELLAAVRSDDLTVSIAALFNKPIGAKVRAYRSGRSRVSGLRTRYENDEEG
jgi:hypothetical protein